MLPSFDVEGKFTKAEILVFTVVLVLATMLPAMAGGATFLLCMSAAGAFFLYHTGKLAASDSKLLPSRVVHASVIYLPVVLGIMAAWKR